MSDMFDHELDAYERAEHGYFDGPVYKKKKPTLPTPKSYPTCRNCGKGGLGWRKVGEKWRLFEGGRQHKCSSIS